MGSLLKTIVDVIAKLLGSSGQQSSHSQRNGTDCSLPPDLEIPSPVSYENVPTALNAGFSSQSAGSNVLTVSAQSAEGCLLTVRPELGDVNLRLGPATSFEPPIASTRGGTTFEVVGIANPLADDRDWFAVRLGTNRSGWIRSDLVTLAQDCRNLPFLDAATINSSIPDPSVQTERFPLPTDARITQGYRPPRHPGFDMGSDTGTPLHAATTGVCIRQIVCTKCTDERPNRQPNANFQCPDLYRDIEWGYGYGNFMVIRHDYNHLPAPMRNEMDRQNLKGGFAYILYAHLSRMDVQLGGAVRGGDVIGATGNTGCSTAPHLHFEVRIGRDADVDNKWSRQTPVHPNLMFNI